MAFWLLQGDPTKYRMLAAAAEHQATTWSARQSADKIAVGDKVVFWLSGDKAGAYAVGEVTAAPVESSEDAQLVPYWVDASTATTMELRLCATQSRLLLLHPVLRTTALEDEVLKEMLVIKRAAGTVFALTSAQYGRIVELADARPIEWTREELIIALAYGLTTNPRRSIAELSRFLDRTEADVQGTTQKLVEEYLHGDNLPGTVADVRAWGTEILTETANEIEAALVRGGGLRAVVDEFRFVQSRSELRLTIARFAREANTVAARASNLIRQTTYWAYDLKTGAFGPTKLVAFANIGIGRYNELVETGAGSKRFDGNVTRRHVEKISGGGVAFQSDPELESALKKWAASLLGKDVLADGLVDSSKWKFIKVAPTGSQPIPRRYWKVAPGEQARLWDFMRQEGITAIGWNNIPLEELRSVAGEAEFKSQVRSIKEDASTSMIAQLWDFLQIRPGDIIVANKGQSTIVGRGEVIGQYQHRPDGEEYRHALPVRWFDTNRRHIPDQGSRWRPTIVELTEAEYRAITPEQPMPKPNGDAGIFKFLEQRGLRFPRELVTTYLLSLKTKPFVILSGISGTGKTKLAQAVAEWAGVEERETEQEEPADLSKESAFAWIYQLKPYNFDHRKIVLAKEYEDIFSRPDTGTTPLRILFDGEEFKGGMGAVHSKGRLLHELRLGSKFAEKLAASFKPDDFVRITVALQDDESQDVTFERVAKEVKKRTELVRRYDFVSVRPDWLDGKEVLGFYNVLTEEYVARPFLRLLLHAHREPEKPFFAILDEMNLARVEHYFADLLSATESRKVSADGVEVDQEPVHLHDRIDCLPLNAPETWERPTQCKSCKGTDREVASCPLWFDGVQLVPPRLKVPRNVHVTGTVNIDETTHQFSPKVLDRANVIEFNQVDLDGATTSDDGAFALTNGLIALGKAEVATLKQFETLKPEVRGELVGLNALLEPFNLHFGYRVANEIAQYVANAEKYVSADSARAAVDLQVLQKVLPKLHGSKQRLLVPLWRLLQFALFGKVTAAEYRDEEFQKIEVGLSTTQVPVLGAEKETVVPRMPRSARKLARMLRTLKEQGFVSFIE